MELKQLPGEFAVCKLTSADSADISREFTFLSVTDEEISLVCEASSVPGNATHVERGWKGLKICGALDFGMVGVIAKISGLLAEQGVSIFVVSTFNTDYLFIKSESLQPAVSVLRNNGYTVD